MNQPAAHKVGIWAFLVAVAYIPGLMSAAIVPRWAIIALGVPLVAQIRMQIPAALQVAIAFGLAWSAASILRAPDPADSLLQLFFVVCLFGAMGVASQLESLDDAMAGLCWGVGISAVFCLVGFASGPLFAQHHPDLFPGLFYNSEVMTEFAAPLLVWAAAKRRWHFVAMAAIPILLNNSRIPIAASLVGLVLVFWPRSWKMRLILLSTVFFVGGIAMAHFTIGHSKFGSAANRVVSWLSTAYAITPTGQGFGWYRASHVGEEFSHSDVLQAFAEIGLGALFFALIPIYALWNRRDHAERAAFVVICIELVVSFPLHVPANGFVAALLAGYLVSNRSRVRDLRPDGRDETDEGDGRYAAKIRRLAGGGGRGGFVVPVRSALADLSALGIARTSPDGAR